MAGGDQGTGVDSWALTIQALKDWHKKQPELFKKKIYDLSGLDSKLMTLGLTLYIAVNTFLEYISCGVSKSTE